MKSFFQLVGITGLFIFFSFTGAKKLVIIDAGHGGNDSGVVINNANEGQIALAIAQKIKAASTGEQLKITLTRKDNQGMSLQQRVEFINNYHPDAVISIHLNTSINDNTSKSGQEIYINEHNAKSALLAKDLLTVFGKTAVVKNANFLLLRNVKAPTVLLEVGFLSNPKEKQQLTSEKGQKAIAEKIIQALK